MVLKVINKFYERNDSRRNFMKDRIKKSESFEKVLLNAKAVEGIKNFAKEAWWDGVAERLIKTGNYKFGNIVIEGLGRNKVDLRKELSNKNKKKAMLNEIKMKFQEKFAKFGDIIRKMSGLENSRDVRNMKLLMTKMALRKISGKDIRGMSDVEIKNVIGKLDDVKFTAKELGDIMNYVRASYGDKTAVQFIEAYLEELAKEVISEYVKDLV